MVRKAVSFWQLFLFYTMSFSPIELQENAYLLDAFYKIITPAKRVKFDQLAAKRTRFLTVVIENIYQEQNASAIVRTCDCFGIQDIHVIEKDNEFSVNREISMGAGRWVDLHHHAHQKFPTAQCIQTLKSKGYRIVATTPHEEDVTIDELPVDQPIALMLGSEKLGLSETALTLADDYVRIPMYGFTESFNVSVSAALCLHALRQRLEKSKLDWKLSPAEQIAVKLHWCKKITKNPDATAGEFLKGFTPPSVEP
jgi:tRNA (guanosine-2'-O-)-methyltransferase